ncbi:MAG: DDE-type integrase/transposase/recombinase [Gammaproteobacteria bacterium]|nr:DDE-type integrase/transposase/recombinase [Gammaproteobacteria bacterium]
MMSVARSSVYAARAPKCAAEPRRRGPKTPWCDAALTEAIRAVLTDSPFVGEGYRKVWAKLRFRGIRTSKARVLRLMREAGLLAPSRSGGPRGPRNHDGTIIPEAPNRMWGTDLTATMTLEEGQTAVFVAIDHATAELVGIHAAKRATRYEALEPLRQGVRRHFGTIGEHVASGLVLRHDHGSQYVSDTFQQELTFLGIESSPSFVRAPEGNGCAERVIRTLKEQLLWVRTFATVEELRLALIEWAELYNEQWLIERHGHRTPAQARRDFESVETAMAA